MINEKENLNNPNKSIWSKIDDIKLNPTMKCMWSVKNVNELFVNGGARLSPKIPSHQTTLPWRVGQCVLDLDVKAKHEDRAECSAISSSRYASVQRYPLSGSGNLNAFTGTRDGKDHK